MKRSCVVNEHCLEHHDWNTRRQHLSRRSSFEILHLVFLSSLLTVITLIWIVTFLLHLLMQSVCVTCYS